MQRFIRTAAVECQPLGLSVCSWGAPLSLLLPVDCISWLYFLVAFLNCTCQSADGGLSCLFSSHLTWRSIVFLHCISWLYFSIVFLDCISWLHFLIVLVSLLVEGSPVSSPPWISWLYFLIVLLDFIFLVNFLIVFLNCTWQSADGGLSCLFFSYLTLRPIVFLGCISRLHFLIAFLDCIIYCISWLYLTVWWWGALLSPLLPCNMAVNCISWL